MGDYAWSQSARRYRDLATGRFLSASDFQNLRESFADTQNQTIEDLTAQLANGDRTLRSWEAEVWTRIRIAFDAEFMAGRGGRNALTDADRSLIARLRKTQREFLRSFAEEIADGGFSEAKIAARAKLYVASSRQAFERGKARSWNLRLPAYPADGSSECMANDRCYWSIDDKPDRVNCYWRLSVAEHCSTCLDRAS
jgi:predicted nucleic acid-binding Zn ribbon protein